jgi:hypothetical protein
MALRVQAAWTAEGARAAAPARRSGDEDRELRAGLHLNSFPCVFQMNPLRQAVWRR